MEDVDVRGGEDAIETSIALLERTRNSTRKELSLEAVEKKMSILIDRIMGEAGLFAPDYAALALKQCEGSVEEAVFLLRAYCSTLSRDYETEPGDPGSMRITRRISAAFKDIAGGQLLGASYDYTHRLIRFEIQKEDSIALFHRVKEELKHQEPEQIRKMPRVSEVLKQEGILDRYQINDEEPFDVTQKPITFPAPRSARLQTLARSDCGFTEGLAYSALRGFGSVNSTVGELRTGYLELKIVYQEGSSEKIWIGEILVTEVEVFSEAADKDSPKLASGYGLVFGRNENKAIAMAVLDHELDLKGDFPSRNEEFVLMHGDSPEMNDFISHLKLPHYVTFQSKLDAIRKTRKKGGNENKFGE